MDYIEAVKNLKTNNKWGRKSPHKAVLMLTVIELYEKNILIDNEIRYDETLKSTFLKIWNLVLPDPICHFGIYRVITSGISSPSEEKKIFFP